jgi:hypothetical protein
MEVAGRLDRDRRTYAHYTDEMKIFYLILDIPLCPSCDEPLIN